MSRTEYRHKYPRRRLIRGVMRQMARVALAGLTNFRVIGKENLPKTGPLIVVANHFHFADSAAVVGAFPWPFDVLGGFHLVDAPFGLGWLPRLWGYYPVYRGASSTDALRATMDVMAQDGVMLIFPEGGSWAPVLRLARPGTAYAATSTGARLLPVGLDGLTEVFPKLGQRRRATVTVRIGKPFGPLHVEGRGPARRKALDELGHEIMRRIAELIPPESRGVYSDDPAIRAAAQEAAIYPYDNLFEAGPSGRQSLP